MIQQLETSAFYDSFLLPPFNKIGNVYFLIHCRNIRVQVKF